MGCYGIGITRTMQAVIEQSHDENGIVWPISVAPFAVCITPLSVAPESEVMKRAEQIYADLIAAGIDVIIDDHNERPGGKFKDSALIVFLATVWWQIIARAFHETTFGLEISEGLGGEREKFVEAAFFGFSLDELDQFAANALVLVRGFDVEASQLAFC